MDNDGEFVFDKRLHRLGNVPGIDVEITSVVDPIPRHSHTFTELFVVLAGQTDHELDGETHLLSSGDVFLMRQGHTHCYKSPHELLVGIVQFTEEALMRLTDQLSVIPSFRALFELEPASRSAHRFESRLCLMPDELSYVRRMIEELRTELEANRDGSSAMTRFLAGHLCGYLSRCYARTPDPKAQTLSRIGGVLTTLEQIYDSEIKISTLASRCYMSESSFFRVFKEATGRTPIEYLNELRIKKAVEILSASDTPITQVAMDVGYNSAEYFTRKFTAIKGVSPQRYRKQLRETS